MTGHISKVIDKSIYTYLGNRILRTTSCRKKKISLGIIIDTAFAIPPKTGVCYRLYYLSKELIENDVNVKLFICNRNVQNQSDLNGLVQEKKLEINIIPEKKFYNPKEMAKIIKNSGVDAIQFEDSETAILIGIYIKEKNKIPLFIELHDAETELKKTIGGFSKKNIKLTNFVHYISAEIADLIIVMTKKDLDIFVKEIGISMSKIFLSPNGVTLKEFPYYGPNTKGNNLIFVGNLFYPPNRDAVKIIIKKIIPKLKNSINKFIVIGMAPRDLIKKYNGAKNIEFTGFVENINEQLRRGTIALCPVISGAGMKVKILNYAAVGLPIISTSIGANGYENLSGLIISEMPNDFIKNIKRLLNNKKKLLELGTLNRMEVIKYFNWSRIAKELAKIYLIYTDKFDIKSNQKWETYKIPKAFWLSEKRVKENKNKKIYTIRKGEISTR